MSTKIFTPFNDKGLCRSSNSVRRLSPGFSYCLLVIILLHHTGSLVAQRLSRDLNVDILLNQAGYTPGAHKSCVVPGLLSRNFSVIDVSTHEAVLSGQFKPAPGDFGNYSTGDFSQVSEEGVYYILSDTLRSYPFTISVKVYEPAMNSIMHYFSKQRCGASETGYLTPCHIDDGVRMDNGKHQDVSGGWHDASDLRKWISATIYGMIAIAKSYELYPELDRNRLIDELKWGNKYFLNMQEPEGYIMSYIGGDVLKHSDSNRWTDNITGGEEPGKAEFTKPNTGRSTADMLLIGMKDDRVIKTDPQGIMGQFNFITAEAMVARIVKEVDPDYSRRCLEAAERCFTWSMMADKSESPGNIGASIQAAIELFKTTQNSTYQEYAVNQARKLKAFQELNTDGEISGFFYTSNEKEEPYKNIWNGPMEFYAICDLIMLIPDHADVSEWKELVSAYARQYYVIMSRKNSFGIVPFGLYTGNDPGGNRKVENYWYRYFMQPERDWWVGINSNLASAGIGLLKASQALNDPDLKSYAQRQLDWIIGANPLNSSTLIGTGYNHPEHFPGSTFYPQTPVIPGAVMNGLGGNHDDQPVIGGGWWQISEYWTPMVAHTLWLMAELSAAR